MFSNEVKKPLHDNSLCWFIICFIRLIFINYVQVKSTSSVHSTPSGVIGFQLTIILVYIVITEFGLFFAGAQPRFLRGGVSPLEKF